FKYLTGDSKYRYCDGVNWYHMVPAPTCAGNLIGGYCWYMGTAGQSCDGVCSSKGGCNLAGTRNYAGSGGTGANCNAVLTALGQPEGTLLEAGEHGLGCAYAVVIRARYTPTTTCAAAVGSVRRACACNQ
ncbi:MAG TPA: hypothetical protein PL182_10375, partial [Pseudobdellovibrionaceae bacterium]|nr:hypothetical protein [Pseudobdellovibrionaceae bacterium]